MFTIKRSTRNSDVYYLIQVDISGGIEEVGNLGGKMVIQKEENGI